MATLGKLEDFKQDAEPFQAYLERVNIFFAANDIPEDKKVPVFLSTIGGTTYGLVRNLVAPDAPVSKSFRELADKLTEHFEPKPIIIAERFHFHKRNQLQTESIAEFIAELRRLAARCKFGGYLDEALRDRFVCGLRSERTQQKLLSEVDLTLSGAVERAKNMEAAHQNAQALKEQALPVGKIACRSARGAWREPKPPGDWPKPCHRCGKLGHTGQECTFRDAECHKCKKNGHIARVCRSAGRQSASPQSRDARDRRYRRAAKWVGSGVTPSDNATTDNATMGPDDLLCNVNSLVLGSETKKPYKVVVEVNGKSLNMEIDTGASVSLISTATKDTFFPTVNLAKTGMSLSTYTAQPIQVLGKMHMSVRYQGYVGWHDLYVVEGVGPSLFGRDWLARIKIDWAEVKAISRWNADKEVERLVAKYTQVFEPGPGVMKHFKAHLALKPKATPRFCRPRAVPYSIKERVGQELDRLVQEGVLRKVDRAEWAAPIVPVPKRDGALRLCGDYKVTINPHLQVDKHPLPKPAPLMACLTGGRKFTKLDLTSAYQQMELDEESAKLVTINTHQGLYESTRLPFGVASAPAIFQRAMDMVLQDIPHCICYLEDILITGGSDSEHFRNLEEVLRRLQDHGIRLKKEKCHFIRESVEYLGHVDARGVHTSKKKVQAIVDASAPSNLQELRSFLGLLNYNAKFILNLASMLHPLHMLLRADQPWKWSDQCQKAFQEAKESLSRAPVLVHYDPALPLILAADASAYSVGAVVFHRMPNGSEQPIAYASRTLSQSERNYAQIEKEALSLVFGIKRFHQYLYGRHFVLMTDHKPLTTILGPKQGIPPLAAARMQRWALLLSAYSYEIKFRSTKMHANADGLSRFPLPEDLPVGNAPDPAIYNMAQLESLPIQAQ